MTFDLSMWPSTMLTNEGSHVASMTLVWLKSIKTCGRYGQMLTLFYRQHNVTCTETVIAISWKIFRWDKKQVSTNTLFSYWTTTLQHATKLNCLYMEYFMSGSGGGGAHSNMKVAYKCLWENKSRGIQCKGVIWCGLPKNGIFFDVDSQK